MPIPPFDRHGNLDVGDLFGHHHSLTNASLAEVRDRFVTAVPGSTRRPEIWDGWMRHRAAIEGFGLPYATLVDGSFLTTKEDPGDVDLCLLFDAGRLNGLGPDDQLELRRLTAGSRCKVDFDCDVYPLVVFPFGDPRFVVTVQRMTYWTRVFGIDRDDRQKSFILVTERGVL